MCLLLVSPKFNDGTGLEPAVVEMSRSVPARTALSPWLHSLPILLSCRPLLRNGQMFVHSEALTSRPDSILT
jgi:hypothetical protein